DIATNKEIRQLPGHFNGVSELRFAPDRHTLLAGSSFGLLHQWDVRTGKELPQLPHRGGIVGIAADGKTMLVRSFDFETRASEFRLVDIAANKVLAKMSGDLGQQANHFALTPDGRTVISLHADQTLRLWSLTTGKQLRQFGSALNEPATDNRRNNFGAFLALSPDGRSVAAVQGTKTVRVWELASGQERRRL